MRHFDFSEQLEEGNAELIDVVASIGYKLRKYAGPIAGVATYLVGDGLIHAYDPLMDQNTKNNMNSALCVLSATIGAAVSGYQRSNVSAIGYASYSLLCATATNIINPDVPNVCLVAINSSIPDVARWVMRDVIDHEQKRERS